MQFIKILLTLLVFSNIFVEAAQTQIKTSFLSGLYSISQKKQFRVHQTKIWRNKIFHVTDHSEEQTIEHSSRDIADHINKNLQKNYLRDNIDLALAEVTTNKAVQLSLPEENTSIEDQVIEVVQIKDQIKSMQGEKQEEIPQSKQIVNQEELAIDLSQIEAGPDSECIIIFSQCNYKGANLKACDNLDELQSFHYKISSIYIPDGLAVTLYNQANFQGDEMNFTESQSCLKNPIDLTGDEE